MNGIPSYSIRNLSRKDEMVPIEGLQEAIWGYGKGSDAPSPYPARCLFEFAESGGLVAGVFSSESEMVAFSASWIGREPTETRRLYLHSQLLGVLDAWRDSGIGTQLKLRQRSFALAEGLGLIKWTFDPLQSRNAILNLKKLGGIVRKFIPDYYGGLRDKVNQHFPTDRFWVEWHINSPRVADRIRSVVEGSHTRNVYSGSIDLQHTKINTVTGSTRRRRCVSVNISSCEPVLLIEIPPNISELRTEAPTLAQEWQDSFRTIFDAYFPKYLISDCIREGESTYYVLSLTNTFHID